MGEVATKDIHPPVTLLFVIKIGHAEVGDENAQRGEASISEERDQVPEVFVDGIREVEIDNIELLGGEH